MNSAKRITTLCSLSGLLLSCFIASCQINQSYSPTVSTSAASTNTIMPSSTFTLAPTITFTSTVTPTPISDVSSVFQRGVIIVPGEDKDIQPGLVRRSLTKIKDLGATSIIITVQWFQADLNSSEIRPLYDRYPSTLSDYKLAYFISVAHEMGFMVMLYPMVGVETFWDTIPHPLEQSWTNIQPPSDEWWDGYFNLIRHYASFAQENHVEYLFAHAELPLTMDDKEHWERVLNDVRQLYDGPVGAAILPDWRIGIQGGYYPWMLNLDFIGIAGFSQGFDTGNVDMTVSQMIAEMEKAGKFDMKNLAYLENLYVQYGKPIIFTEISNPSYDGATAFGFSLEKMEGGDVTPDLQEQADFFEASFRNLYSKPWTSGIFVGDWFLGVSGDCYRYNGWSIGLDVVDKPAATVIKHWFSQTNRQTASSLPLKDDGHVETGYINLQDLEEKLDYPCHHIPPIVIDGELDDWSGFFPLIVDPKGDNNLIETPNNIFIKPEEAKGPHDATDLVALYAYHTQEYLVLAIEGASGLNRELNYQMFLDFNKDGKADAQVFVGQPPYETMDWEYYGRDKSLDTFGFGRYSKMGTVLELAIPLEVFGYPESINIQGVSNCYCYLPNWEQHDTIGTPYQWYKIP